MRRIAGTATGARHAASLAIAGALLAMGAGAQAPPPAPAQQAPPQASAPAPAQPAADRITFDLKVPAERGGGSVSGAADTIETFDEATVAATGAVEIKYRDLTVQAERLVLHRDSMTLEAEGDVVFDQGPQRIAGQRVDFDLVQRTGTFWSATAFVHPDYYFSGEVIAKTGPEDYAVSAGRFTSCTGDPTPDWSFAMSSADVELGGYAKVRNARLNIKKLPVFYWPYILWPAKTERTSGLLVPNIGYSKRRGSYLGLAYYQTLGPSYDTTFYLDGYSEGFYGFGDELRYRPSETTEGEALAYYFYNDESQKSAWKLKWAHEAKQLPWGLRGVVDVEHYSDYLLFRDFERGERENTRRYLYSNAFLAGNWGAQSLNVLLDQRETFITDADTVTQRQLPEIEYRLRERKLGGSPLYLSLAATGSYLQSTRDGSYDAGYGRFDVEPELKLPVRPAPWLSLAISAGGRATWWGDSVVASRPNAETGQLEPRCGDRLAESGEIYCGESLDRVYPAAGVEMVGPSFSRIFELSGKHFAKLKHIIEPRWSYGYLGTFDDQDRVAQFDEIDVLRPSNVAELAIVNRVLAKPAGENKGGAFEIFSFELAQAYSFDTEQPLQSSADGTQTSASSALFGKLRFNPAKSFSLQAQVQYNTLFPGLDATSLSGTARLPRGNVGLTWFTRYRAETGDTLSDQVRLSFGADIVKDRLRLDGQINYDVDAGEFQQQRYFLNYVSQCWSIRLEGREYRRSTVTDRDYRFALTFKNVGTFLDLTGGSSVAN